jgi:polyisoprenoid-binding protein YceI
MKKIKYVFLFLTFNLASQDTTSNNLIVDSNTSYISYQGKHILHDWVGINNNVKGILVIEDAKASKIAISASVKDFDSGNSSRDSHALELIESLIYPKITFFSDELIQLDENINILGVINFHGIEKQIKVTGRINREKPISLSGKFVLSPSEFKVKLPSFMLSKMEDNIEIKFQLNFN